MPGFKRLPTHVVGQKFNRLTVREVLQERTADRRFKVKCDCECGTTGFVTPLRDIQIPKDPTRKPTTQSCGCLRQELLDRGNVTHGLSRTRTYKLWKGMMTRCYNAKRKFYPRYGGRGITVCDRWKTYLNFLADLGECPPGHSLERKNNDAEYSPENCCWIPADQQAENRSGTIRISDGQRTQSLKAWCRELAVPYDNARKLYHSGLPLVVVLFKGKLTPEISRELIASTSSWKLV